MIIDGGNQAAQEPSGGIAHCDGDDLVTDTRHSEQVYLPESNKGCKHDDHRRPGIAGAAECAGVDLIEATEDVEGRQPPQQHGTVFHNLRLCVKECHDLRGAGNTRAPMVIMLASFVAFRQVYLFTMARICNEIIPIAMSYPAGWLLCSLLTAVYYHKAQLGRSRLVEDN